MLRLTIDFETRSDVSLDDVGSWMYSRHPSTEVMCVGWGDGFIDGQWKHGNHAPQRLFNAIRRSDVTVAHNAFFEFCVWLNVCVQKYGWPEVPQEKWRCSASKAAAAAMPRALEKCGVLLNLEVVKDDKEGRAAMLRLSRGKGKPGDEEKMLRYNMNDVYSEIALDEALPDLTPHEVRVWQMSERMNRRGFHIDRRGATKAAHIASEYGQKLMGEFQKITGIEKPTQRAKFLVWLNNNGIHVTNTQADTIDDEIAIAMRQGVHGLAHRAMEIVREIGMSSVGKYRSALVHIDTDDRARGCFVYSGAHTRRWAGKDVQPQNFKRDCPYKMEQAWQDLMKYDLDQLEVLYGLPLEFLAAIVRGVITARSGTRLVAGDYAQIEARIVFWLSGEKRGLAVFERGEDMYLDMASTIWGRKIVKSKENEMKRYIGKHAVLSLGFGSGYIKFLTHIRDLGAPPFSREMIREVVPAGWLNATLRWIMMEDWSRVLQSIPGATRRDAEELVLTKWIVDKYRKQYKDTVVKYWYDCENAARAAITYTGQTFTAGKLSFTCGKNFLNLKLPSGGVLRYLHPKLEGNRITYTEQTKMFRVDTYGGKLVENAVQATSRDIMAERMLALEEHEEYRDIVMTVHDEVINEVEIGRGSVEEYCAILAERPKWCLDLPIKVEGWEGNRYKKG